MIEECNNLENLWKIVHDLNEKHFPNSSLMPILGNGKKSCPKIMFVFINPTAKNISSDKNWKGERFPFVGTKNVWRIFHKAGLFNDDLMSYIENNKNWSLAFTNELLKFLKKKSFYLTNIVKWTGKNSALPNSEKIKLFLPILEKEIEIVKPEYIVTFGLIPFENLTKNKIKLNDYYTDVIKNNKLNYFENDSGPFKSKVIACYFPVGRGNPKRAVEILKLIRKII